MKILMATNGLDIGGAETHILELCLALRRMGHDITVASNGGVYEADLASAGVRCVRLPLNSKKLKDVFASRAGLARLIKTERYDIVHAHARIPAAILGSLRRSLKFKFVTTAHWVFNLRPLWRLLANWGDRCIAVSEDIKQYVIDEYSYYPDSVSVTINGIDTVKFSPDTPCADIAESFGMKSGVKTVLCVSRIDTDRSLSAFLLCDAAFELFKSGRKLNVVIVGAGSDYKKLNEKVREINECTGCELIKLAGSHTDINKFIAACDIFVGVSRAALEAMSAARPVILAGNEGYLGIYRKELFEKAYDGNFCCRQTRSASVEELARDIESLMDMPDKELAVIAGENRELIKQVYSVEHMADDYLRTYSELAPYETFKLPDIVISGYYGFGNMGDDSFLQVMVREIKKARPGVKLCVLSKTPRKTAQIYGVMSIGRLRIIKIYSLMRSASLLISGGGSLMQDETSSRSFIYYTVVMRIAKLAGAKLMIYSNGIGPINNNSNIKTAQDLLTAADAVTLREPSSYEFCKKLPGIKAELSCDPALLLEPCGKKREELLLKKCGICDFNCNCNFNCNNSEYKKYFAVSVRSCTNKRHLVEELGKFCAGMRAKGYEPVFFPLQRKADMGISMRVQKACGGGIIAKELTAGELIAVLKRMEFVVGMRLHILIYASAAGKNAIGIAYDPKIRDFLEYIDSSFCVMAESFTANELTEMSEDIIIHKNEYEQKLTGRVRELKKLAVRDARTAAEFVPAKD